MTALLERAVPIPGRRDESPAPDTDVWTQDSSSSDSADLHTNGWEGLARKSRGVTRSRLFQGIAASGDLVTGLAAWLLLGMAPIGVLVLLAGMMTLALVGSYVDRLNLRVLDAVPRMIVAMGLAGTSVAVTLHLLGGAHLEAQAGAIVSMVLIWTPLLLLGRRLSYSLIRKLRTTGHLNHRTLLVGAMPSSERLVHLMHEHPDHGLVPVGYVASAPPTPGAEFAVPYLGQIRDLARITSELDVSRVIVVTSGMPIDHALQAVSDCHRQDVEVFVEAATSELLGERTHERIGPVAVFKLSRRPHRTAQWRAKRILDSAIAGVALVILSPILLVAGVLVKRETGAALLFRQPRVGFDGHTFELLKLQTMVPASSTESATQWNISNDARLGPVGRFLRRTSIDELPQLINILRGDMSLVGPRPERPHFVEMFQEEHPRYLARHRVPSGLTGFAQVEGMRGDTSISERVAFDNLYIEQWSIWLDIKIILRTVPAVFRGEGG